MPHSQTSEKTKEARTLTRTECLYAVTHTDQVRARVVVEKYRSTEIISFCLNFAIIVLHIFPYPIILLYTSQNLITHLASVGHAHSTSFHSANSDGSCEIPFFHLTTHQDSLAQTRATVSKDANRTSPFNVSIQFDAELNSFLREAR